MGKKSAATPAPEKSGPTESRNFIGTIELNRAEAIHQNRLSWLISILLVALVWVVFGQTAHFEFINYDDPPYVYKNPTITQGLSWAGVVWTFTHVNVGTWFPLTDFSHQLIWQFCGAQAGGHHLGNVALHAATVVLLFLALRRLTGALWPSAFVAASFAIHPLRVESVAWVVERKDVLSGFFFMATLWAWARYVEQRVLLPKNLLPSDRGGLIPKLQRATLGYYLALAFFALGLLAKSMLVTLPCILLLLDYWPLNRLTVLPPVAGRSALRLWRNLVWEKIPFFTLSLAISVVTVLTQKNAVTLAQGSSLFWRVGQALSAYTDYLGHLFYPVGLTVSYERPETNPALWTVVFSALVLAAISVAVIVGRRKYPYLIVGWLWYLGMFLPVVDIMQAGQNFRADRYTYLPQIGLGILLTWGTLTLVGSGRSRKMLLGSAAMILLLVLTVSAHRQTSHWKNSETLWRYAIACTPNNAFAYNNLGNTLAEQDKLAAASQSFQQALQLQPDYADAHLNLGAVFDRQDQPDQAIQHYELALAVNPYSSKAHYFLGHTLALQNRTSEAISQFEKAIQCWPEYAEAHYALGLALATQAKWEQAIPHYEQALHLKLDPADARYISGVALASQNKLAEAIQLYEQALQLKPEFAEARNNLAIALASQGKMVEAAQSSQQALSLATAQGNKPLAESIRQRLETYRGQSTNGLPRPK